MKLLESSRFEAINSALSIQTGDSAISGRIESYSCKMAGGDKALYKRFTSDGATPHDLQALSPPQTGLGMSPGCGSYRWAKSPFVYMTYLTCFYLRCLRNMCDIFLVEACLEMKKECFVIQSLEKPYSIWLLRWIPHFTIMISPMQRYKYVYNSFIFDKCSWFSRLIMLTSNFCTLVMYLTLSITSFYEQKIFNVFDNNNSLFLCLPKRSHRVRQVNAGVWMKVDI